MHFYRTQNGRLELDDSAPFCSFFDAILTGIESIPSSIIGPALVGGAGIASSIIGSNAASDAAAQQQQAAQAAQQQQQAQFAQTQAALQPFVKTGTNALAALAQQMGVGPDGSFNANAPLVKPFTAADFTSSPGYGFAKSEGIDSILNRASSLGGPLSGNVLKELDRYGTGLANQDFFNQQNLYRQQQGDVFGRLSNLAGTGASAAGSQGQFGATNANALSNLITGAGAAGSAGTIGSAGALAGGINSLAGVGQNLEQQNFLANLLRGFQSNNSNPFVNAPAPSSGFFGSDASSGANF